MVSASALSKNRTWLADLPREVLLETDFSDTGRILDILKQRKIALERGFANSGHSCAAVRVKSYYTRSGVVHEHVGNVDYYRFLCDLIEHFDERAGELSERLSDIAERLFCDDNCTMSFAGSDDDYEAFWKSQPTCGRVGSGEKRLVIPEPTVRNEAFIVPSDVCFASIGWDRRLLGIPYDGSWAVAGRALSLDYLWNEVRVKGGAYGVGFQALDAGNMRFYTYRDPHLDERSTVSRKHRHGLPRSIPSRGHGGLHRGLGGEHRRPHQAAQLIAPEGRLLPQARKPRKTVVKSSRPDDCRRRRGGARVRRHRLHDGRRPRDVRVRQPRHPRGI